MKTRYAKPFEGIQVKIPYETGMNPYSGLVDLCEKKSLLVREGNSLKYTTSSGDEIKQFRKAWERNEGGSLDIIMNDWENKAAGKEVEIVVESDVDNLGEENYVD